MLRRELLLILQTMTKDEARLALTGYFGPGCGEYLKWYLSQTLNREVSEEEAREIVYIATRADRFEDSIGSVVRSETVTWRGIINPAKEDSDHE